MRKIILFVLICLLGQGVAAQQDISLYTLNNVFQQSYINPAYLPKSSVNVGLPVISSIYFNGSNTGFPLGRFLSPNGGRKVDIDKMINNLSKNNLLAADFNTDLLSLGIKIKSTYLSFSFSEVFNMNFVYPKDFFVFLFKGNGDEELLGRRANFDGLAFNMNLYHQAALGLSIPVGEKFRAGARVKYLMGLLNVTTTKSKLGVTTGADNFALTLDGALALKTSGFGLINSEDAAKVAQERLLNPGTNTGLALDLGAEYFFTDRITFSASLLNMGYIKWTNDVKNFENDDINYTFSGINVQNFGSTDFTKELQDKLDTLSERVKFKESTDAYSARLNPQVIVAGNLAVNDYNSVGAIVRSELIGKILRPSASFYYQFKVNHWLGATVNYSYLNKSLVNIGGGFCVKLLPFQFYIASDNVLAPLALITAKGVQLRAGINLAFGGKEPKKLRVPVYDPSKE